MAHLGREHAPLRRDSECQLAQAPNAVIGEFYAQGYAKDQRDEPTRDFVRSAIPFDEGLALYNWIRVTKPRQTLEVGMAYGLSTLFICQAHHDNGENGRHFAIDPEQDTVFRSIGVHNVRRAGLDEHLQFFAAPSYLILPQLLERQEHLDMVFLDGMHTFDFTLVDFFYVDMLLRLGGNIVFDDIWMPSVRKAMIYVMRNRHYQLEPKLFGKRNSIWNRLRTFATRQGKRQRIRLNTKQFLQDPFDLLTFAYLGHWGFKGGVKYWAIEKVANDDRPWDFHVAF